MEKIYYPLLIFISMVAWSVLHSWLAALSTKKRAQSLLGKNVDRYYRLTYVVIAILTLIPILALLVLLPSQRLWISPSPWIYLTLALQLMALTALIITIFHTDVFAFTGFRQVTNPYAEEENNLVTSGFYKVVRHPLYLFGLILLWFIPYMTDLILAFVISSSLYLLIGTIPEERKLLVVYGKEYEKYQEIVPRIIPGLKGKEK